MIRPRQLRQPPSLLFIFHPVANKFSVASLLRNESTNCAPDPTRLWSHLRILGSWGLGVLVEVVMSHLSHALPSRAKAGHFPSANRRHHFRSPSTPSFLSGSICIISSAIKPTTSPSATRHSPVFKIQCTVYCVIVQYLGIATGPGLADT